MRQITGALIILAVILIALSAPVSAAWERFKPTPLENIVELEARGSYEVSKNESDGRGLRVKDSFVKEKLSLYSLGYVYHPRFIMYNLSLSGAVNHEKLETSTTGSTGWRTGTGSEFDVDMVLLPEHPYNLKLFIRRAEPLAQGQLSGQTGNVILSRGALFRYRKKPYFFHTKYIITSTESAVSSSDVNIFGVDGSYYKQLQDNQVFSLIGGYNRSDFVSSTGTTGLTDSYSFGNIVELGKVGLSSSLSKTSFEQEGGSGSFGNRQTIWSEDLHAKLPLNFETGLTYSVQENAFDSRGAGTTPASSTTSDTVRSGLTVSHRLYQSLENTYSYRHIFRSSPTGDAEDVSQALTTLYTKIIPRGLLTAGLNVGRTISEISGQTTVVNESHQAVPACPFPESFVLNSQRADPLTIRVFLKNPEPPSQLIPLTENEHYTVTPLGNTFQINIFATFIDTVNQDPEFNLNLPACAQNPSLTLDFILFYSQRQENIRLGTYTSGFNTSLSIMNNMLRPYYTFSSVESEVLAGDFQGDPIDADAHTVGLMYSRAPFTSKTEYQYVRSNIAPYRAWSEDVSYTTNITETARFIASAGYSDTNYFEGMSVEGGEEFSLTTVNMSASIIKRIPAKNMMLNGGYSYSYISGLTKGTGSSVHGGLLWKVGKLSVSLGASVSSSESESASQASRVATNLRQFYFLSIKRKLL